ncbi:hypothetical protein PV367_29345 [Streptomyces europaeiscabiei]|uniref:Secreted protein n=1 Tax=Streptomyces europaeiscabiei TaxID=146819 RepID=A0AAJ2PUT9_9ACTN|nr:hypothetical protein [Streptomyces europaeiscabiei]MDX3133794.1 hypothetical protein [Streptomyces europaeiscabiei]MDX3689731.1 hypothetical protein [Streptomyces europaeiscabiei]
MKKRHLAASGILALAAVAVAQPSASAATLSVSNAGARASYNTATSVLEVCDIDGADGKRAVATLERSGTVIQLLRQVSDTNGAGNSCARATVPVASGSTIVLTAWVQAGASGAPEDKVSRQLRLS